MEINQGEIMTGKIVCVVYTTASLLVLLWFCLKKQEKNKKDAVKVLVLTGCLGFILCITESNSQRLQQDGRLLRNAQTKHSETK